MTSFNFQAEKYSRLAAQACATLEDQLSRIRGDYDRGEISLIEAANERIVVMTEYLNRLRLLRDEFLA